MKDGDRRSDQDSRAGTQDSETEDSFVRKIGSFPLCGDKLSDSKLEERLEIKKHSKIRAT